LSADDVKLVVAVLGLRQAYDAKDPVAMKNAFQVVYPYLADRWAGQDPENKEQARKMAEAESRSIFGDAGFQASARVKISQLVTRYIEAARLVWYFYPPAQRFLPAAYCPDFLTAAFLTIFMSSSLHVCPHCGKMFFPVKTNVNYCCPAHREAHRIARWRAAKKELEQGKSVRYMGIQKKYQKEKGGTA